MEGGGVDFSPPNFCSILPVGFTYCTTSLHLPNPKLKLLLSIGPNALSTSQIIDYHAVPFSPPGKRNYPLFNSPPPPSPHSCCSNLEQSLSLPSPVHSPSLVREGLGQEIITKSIFHMSDACVVQIWLCPRSSER